MSYFIRLFAVSFLLFGAKTQANELNFSYAKNKQLTIAGNTCLYGRKDKESIQQSSIKQIQNYVLQQPSNFENQIKSINTGMLGRRLEHAKLAVLYQLKAQQIDFDYYFEGNESCARFVHQLTLDFNQDFSQLLTLSPADNYSFFASSQADVINHLSAIYPNIDEQVLTSEHLIKVTQTGANTLYRFDAKSFLTANTLNSKTVFITGNKLLISALSKYLAEYDYRITSTNESAYWHLDAKLNSNQSFSINYQAKNQKRFTIKNDQHALPDMASETDKEIIDVLILYLELMELTNLLTP